MFPSFFVSCSFLLLYYVRQELSAKENTHSTRDCNPADWVFPSIENCERKSSLDEKSVRVEFLAGIEQQFVTQLLGSGKIIVHRLAVVMLNRHNDFAKNVLQLT